MIGGLGNDTYNIDSNDTTGFGTGQYDDIIENTGEGTDTVNVFVNANLEFTKLNRNIQSGVNSGRHQFDPWRYLSGVQLCYICRGQWKCFSQYNRGWGRSGYHQWWRRK